MSHENLENCCGSCGCSKPLSTKEFVAVNSALAGMRGQPYTHACTVRKGLLVSNADLPFTTRFPEETFPNLEAESCYSPVNLQESKSA